MDYDDFFDLWFMQVTVTKVIELITGFLTMMLKLNTANSAYLISIELVNDCASLNAKWIHSDCTYLFRTRWIKIIAKIIIIPQESINISQM